MNDIYQLFTQKPDILELYNDKMNLTEGYNKSLKEDEEFLKKTSDEELKTLFKDTSREGRKKLNSYFFDRPNKSQSWSHTDQFRDQEVSPFVDGDYDDDDE